jgi:hypothetical protein
MTNCGVTIAKQFGTPNTHTQASMRRRPDAMNATILIDIDVSDIERAIAFYNCACSVDFIRRHHQTEEVSLTRPVGASYRNGARIPRVAAGRSTPSARPCGICPRSVKLTASAAASSRSTASSMEGDQGSEGEAAEAGPFAAGHIELLKSF